MADTYKIDLGTISGKSGGHFFTVAKGTEASSAGVETKLSTNDTIDSTNFTAVGSVTLDSTSGAMQYYYDVDNSPVSIGGAATKSAWTITTGSKADIVVTDNITSGTISTGAGDDTISGSGSGIQINAGDGADSISVSGANVTIDAGDGANEITVTGASNQVTAGSGADKISVAGKESTVTAGTGNDTIFVKGDTVTVDAGDGADSIAVQGKNATITLGAGKDTVSIGATGATITDYVFGEDTIVTNGTAVDLTSLSSDGKIAISSSADVTINSTGGYYVAALASVDGADAVNYAWAGESGTTMDASSQKVAFKINGATNDEGDLILGGSKADTILAGTGDSVVGGKGDDSISIAAKATGVVVGLYNQSGTDTVQGFSKGFDDDNTTIYVDSSATKFTIGATSASDSLTFGSKGTTIKTDATLDSGVAKVKVNYNGTVENVEAIYSSGALDEDATVVYGVGSTAAELRLTGADDYNIDLSGNKGYGDTRTYQNVTKVDASAGTGDYILVGDGSTKNTLGGGTSSTSLWGGGSSADSLTGGSGDDTFYYGSGDGKDTIHGYSASGTNGDDIINFYSGNITKVKATSSGVTVTLDNSYSNKLTIDGNSNITSSSAMTVKYTTDGTNVTTAQIGLSTTANSFTYDEDVTQYIGSSKGDTLKVTSGNDANIWLDGSTGVSYGNIKTVNASETNGNVVIAGSTANETITGSTGSASLFGGFGSSNDVLASGSSVADTTFYFGKGCGSDTISRSYNADKVMLYDVNISDIDFSNTGVKSSALVITLTDGSKLTVNNYTSGANTFTLADGSSWSYDTSSKGWVQA